jgi:hypothetical protein
MRAGFVTIICLWCAVVDLVRAEDPPPGTPLVKPDPGCVREVAPGEGFGGDWRLLEDGKTLLAFRTTPEFRVNVRWYDVATGKLLREHLHETRHGSVYWIMKDGKRFWANANDRGGEDKPHALVERDAGTGKEIRRLEFKYYPGPVTMNADERFLAVVQPVSVITHLKYVVDVCDLRVDRRSVRLEGHEGSINRFAFTPDGKHLISR